MGNMFYIGSVGNMCNVGNIFYVGNVGNGCNMGYVLTMGKKYVILNTETKEVGRYYEGNSNNSK